MIVQGGRIKYMAGIDIGLKFIPIQIAIMTISDTRTIETDTSGDILVSRVRKSGHAVIKRQIVRDEIGDIRTSIKSWSERGDIDAIITTGGTGLTGRDVTVEAITPLFDKVIDGFSVIFHQISYGVIGLSTLQSRACAGIVNGTFVFCLPGSNGAVKDGWDKVIKAQLDSRHRPCNMIDLMPRLNEV